MKRVHLMPMRYRCIGAVFLCLCLVLLWLPGVAIFALEHTLRSEGMGCVSPSVPRSDAFRVYALSLEECMSIEGGDVRMVLKIGRASWRERV